MKWTRELILIHTKNRFFSVLYEKADGSSRKIVCRLGVKKYIKADSRGRSSNVRVITVYDMVKKNYRSLRLERIKSITVSKETIR